MSKRSFLGLLITSIVAVFMLATPSNANAQPAPGKVVGLVVDVDGKPVANAQVVLMHDHEIVARVRTNADGKYAFERVRPGPYQVSAGKPDVGRGHERAAVRSGETVRVRIVLKKQ